MKKRLLGKTGIAVAPIALGCGSFGGIGSPKNLIGLGLDPEASFAAMDEAVTLGIDLFDTAYSYAGGASETLMGEWLKSQSTEVRGRIRMATKVGTVVDDGGTRIDLSPQRISEQLNASLERLGVDRVDFCLCHAPDPETPIEATLEGFAAAIGAGKVSYIGACNVTATQLREALEASARLGLPRYDWVQNEYNLMHREDERDLFLLCEEHNVGLTPFSSMAGGVLSGKYARDQVPPPDSRLALRPDGRMPSTAQFDAIDRLSKEAARRGVSTAALALAWVVAHPLVTAAITGPARSAEHLGAAREALAIELDQESRLEVARWFE